MYFYKILPKENQKFERITEEQAKIELPIKKFETVKKSYIVYYNNIA